MSSAAHAQIKVNIFTAVHEVTCKHVEEIHFWIQVRWLFKQDKPSVLPCCNEINKYYQTEYFQDWHF